MHNNIPSVICRLSDADLVMRVKHLLSRERDALAELIAHLAELDTRDVHLREGYPSLYFYCRDALGLSEWEAYNRIEVARTARRFPIVLGLLADGSVDLTTVRLLAPHLTPENHQAVLEEARGKRKADVQAMVVRFAPKPDAPSLVRRVPAAAVSPGPSNGDMQSFLMAAPPLIGSDAGAAPTSPNVSQAPSARAVTTALSPDRYKYQVTIGGETLEKIRCAKDMLGHAIPSGDDAAILDRAFTALLAELARKKFADRARADDSTVGRPGMKEKDAVSELDSSSLHGKSTGGALVTKQPPRRPSAAVKRAVWMRDLGRCAFVGSGGHRCNERRFVEFHHVDPYALGGEATVDGIQLRCRAHNDYEGRLWFGARGERNERGQRGDSGLLAGLVPEQVELSMADSRRAGG